MEKIEEDKSKLLSQMDENTSKKMQKTTEHGRLLMSIDNLYNKCLKKEKLLSKSKISDLPKDFDEIQKRGKCALQQLEIIKSTTENFKELHAWLNAETKLQQKLREKKEKFEIL